MTWRQQRPFVTLRNVPLILSFIQTRPGEDIVLLCELSASVFYRLKNLAN